MGYPVPRRENEMRAKSSSPVHSYTLVGEELEKLRARMATTPTNAEGQPLKKPVAINQRSQTEPRQVRGKPRKPKASITSKAQIRTTGEKQTPSLPDFLQLIALGKTIADVERLWGMSKNSLYYWVKKWGLIGINPKMARAKLEQQQISSKQEARL